MLYVGVVCPGNVYGIDAPPALPEINTVTAQPPAGASQRVPLSEPRGCAKPVPCGSSPGALNGAAVVLDEGRTEGETDCDDDGDGDGV